MKARLLRRLILFLTAMAGCWVAIPHAPLLEGVPFSREVLDRNGKHLKVLLTDDDKYRVHVPLAEISPLLVEATLTHEDQWFYRHPGVNPVALLRTVYRLCRSGSSASGASTLTMQVARLRFGLHTRTAHGKLVQIYRALQLERHYSKQEILEAYFNLAPYGRNIEGAGAASLLYLGKSPAALSLPEAVALSVIPQSPTSRAPFPTRENVTLTAAQNRLLSRMGKSDDGLQKFLLTRPAYPDGAPHFVRQVLAEDGKRLRTTLDLELQQATGTPGW